MEHLRKVYATGRGSLAFLGIAHQDLRPAFVSVSVSVSVSEFENKYKSKTWIKNNWTWIFPCVIIRFKIQKGMTIDVSPNY